MRRKDQARREARRLRADLGWSLARIARELGVAKSSVSLWVRDVALSGSRPIAPESAIPVRALVVWRSGRLRRCGRRGCHLPLECFNRSGEGRQWWCRKCFALYFRRRGDAHRAQSRAAKRARQRRLRALVLHYLREYPCVDCGEDDPVVLEFDHLGEKAAAIAELVAASATLAAVEAEIARCEVVCSNCHRRRTARRAGWRRLSTTELARRPYPTHVIARNFAHLEAILAGSGCVDCGERDVLLLEFDHIGTKRANVTRLAWSGSSVATLDEEIRHCEVRCANCHRRITAERGGHFRFRALTSAGPP